MKLVKCEDLKLLKSNMRKLRLYLPVWTNCVRWGRSVMFMFLFPLTACFSFFIASDSNRKNKFGQIKIFSGMFFVHTGMEVGLHFFHLIMGTSTVVFKTSAEVSVLSLQTYIDQIILHKSQNSDAL